MCVGVQAEAYPNKFTYLPAEAFEAMLASSPSISGVTLSSGDSDPLLHPQLDKVLASAKRHRVQVDVYTNGHALTEAKAKLIIESGVVGMINVSIDAATPETYRRIRGADLARVRENVARLGDMKAAANAPPGRPWVSVSMVVMADNIHELPAFVEMAAALRASRVNMEDLIGWQDRRSDNRPAGDHPDAGRYLRAARDVAAKLSVKLFIPEGLLPLLEEAPSAAAATTAPAAAPPAATLNSCSWVEGLYVNGDATISPCCMIHKVADMGTVHDGAIHANTKYVRVKELLFSGKVFDECSDRPCQFVQQQKARGVPLTYITAADLGDLAPRRAPAAPVALTVNGRPAASAA